MFSFFRKKKKIEYRQEEDISKLEEFTEIEPILHYFHKKTGITFEKQITIFTNKVVSFCRQHNIYSFIELLDSLNVNSVLKQKFIDFLTTNETYFYREFKQIERLTKLVLLSHKNVKILCAPSSTGEEAYSIAIALLESGVPASKFHIIGIDINKEAIDKAKNAKYSQRNIQNLSLRIRNKYFLKENDYYALDENIKSLVTFQLSNIFENSFVSLGKFDFVFSRNMLIYFDKETKMKAKNILESMRISEEYPVFFGHADLF